MKTTEIKLCYLGEFQEQNSVLKEKFILNADIINEISIFNTG